jgi:hypothetical protein
VANGLLNVANAMPSNISKLGCFEQNYNDIVFLIHTSLLKIESSVIKGGPGCYVMEFSLVLNCVRQKFFLYPKYVANSSIHSPHLWRTKKYSWTSLF